MVFGTLPRCASIAGTVPVKQLLLQCGLQVNSEIFFVQLPAVPDPLLLWPDAILCPPVF